MLPDRSAAPLSDAFSIRPARRGDLDAVVAIENAAFTSNLLSRRSLAGLTRSSSARLLVAVGGGAVQGYAVLLLRRGGLGARLYSLAVLPGRAGKGIGRALLAAVEDEAARAGRSHLRLEVRADNARAIRLYEAAGYRRIARLDDYYADGASGWRMEKPLAPGRSEAA